MTPLKVGFVCEGPTDTPVLEAVVEAIFGDFEPLYIQPQQDAVDGGDTRVEAWCKEFGTSLKWYLINNGVDFLIVHLDADRTRRYGVSNTQELCDLIKQWLGPGAREPSLIIVIPSQAIEAWLVAAHLPVNPQFEQVLHPEEELAASGLIDRRDDGSPKKDRIKYNDLARLLTARLSDCRKTLPELQRFASKLEHWAA